VPYIEEEEKREEAGQERNRIWELPERKLWRCNCGGDNWVTQCSSGNRRKFKVNLSKQLYRHISSAPQLGELRRRRVVCGC